MIMKTSMTMTMTTMITVNDNRLPCAGGHNAIPELHGHTDIYLGHQCGTSLHPDHRLPSDFCARAGDVPSVS